MDALLVHFAGHGHACGDLVLQNEYGHEQPVAPDALADLFKPFSKKIRCVVLNSCFSQKQAAALNKHVRYVFGTLSSIQDDVAVEFAKAFYGSFFATRDYEHAFQSAQTAVRIHNPDLPLNDPFKMLRKTHIKTPCDGDTLAINFNPVGGIDAGDYPGHFYLLTGDRNNAYYPSERIKRGPDAAWSARVHVGAHSPTATIRLIAADDCLADYIEFYRKYAAVTGHKGFVLSHPPNTIDIVTVTVNLMPLRERLLGRYDVFDENDASTGEIVDIALSGVWGVEVKCMRGTNEMWQSTILMDDHNPNIGKGVFSCGGQTKGQHYITFRESDLSIRVNSCTYDKPTGTTSNGETLKLARITVG